MSAIRRFDIEDNVDVFTFQVDTRLIVSGATNGSQNNLTFKIPFNTINNSSTTCIVRIDGLPDISIVGQSESNSKSLITFPSPGIYTIKIYGFVGNFTFYAASVNWDLRKIIRVIEFSKSVILGERCFYNCVNLVIDIQKPYKIRSVAPWFFRGIKAINSSLHLFDTSSVTDVTAILFGIQNPLNSTLNPFFSNLAVVIGLYSNSIFTTDVNKIEIISNSVTSLSEPWHNVAFQNTGSIEIICQTPNLTTMFRVFYTGAIRDRCHAGNIDVRNVTNTNEWLRSTWTTDQVDATLLGWAQLPFMQSGVTWNWNGSKYSNNPAVIAAYNKITNDWGVIFTGLTMA